MQVKRRGSRVIGALIGLLVGVLVACAHPPRTAGNSSPSPERVVVASFNFPESELLAEIYAQALEHSGVPVRRVFNLGPRELVQPAQRQGLVDVVPEYLGAALASVTPNAVLDWTNEPAVLAALRRAVSPWGLTVLQPAAASDQDGFAVSESTAARLHLHTLSDFAKVAPQLTMGGPSECPRRPYCLAGLQRVYGVHVRQFLAFDDPAQRTTALDEGVIDVAVTFTTDGQLATGHLVLLRDDRRLQPTEQVAPMVSSRSLAWYGTRLADTLNAVSAALDTGSLTFLNWRVSVAGKGIGSEARGWLNRHAAFAAAR
jgi:osmoprotectant transport system substrate-binding protein